MSAKKEDGLTEKEMIDNVITITAKNFKYAIENGTNNIAIAMTSCVDRYCAAAIDTNKTLKEIEIGKAALRLHCENTAITYIEAVRIAKLLFSAEE
jgi:hypothetical protein